MSKIGFSSIYETEYYLKNIRTDLQFWRVDSVWKTPEDGRINTAIMMPLTLVAIYRFKDGTTLSASPGDIVLMPKGSIYTCTFEAFNGDIIECRHQGFARSCLFFGFDIFDTDFREVIPSDLPRILFHSGCHDFIHSFIRLCKLRHRPDYTPSQLCIEAMQFINPLSKKLQSSGQIKKDEDFSRITEYIHKNLESVSSGELIRISGLSASTLQRRFSERFGMTPTAYINSIRIEKAKGIFESGMTKICKVSHLCGIEDEFYFSRLFSKLVGMSPTEYLKMIKNNNK